MTHTPGPWNWRPAMLGTFRRPRIYAEARPDHPVATIYFNEANARLIAAAPDLLAALQEIRSLSKSYGAGDDNWILSLQSIADAAIAKAQP